MKFRLLDINTTNSTVIPENGKPFRFLTYHIAEMYMEFLPLIEINNSSKICIFFGKMDKFDLELDAEDGVTSIFIEDFDFKSFYNSTIEEQNLIILKHIECSLISIYKRSGNDSETIKIIQDVAIKVVENNFSTKTLIKKLSKLSKDRKYKINIFRVLNNTVGEACLCEIENKIQNETYNTWLTNTPSYVDIRQSLKKATINDETYTVFNAFNKVVSQVKYREIIDNKPIILVRYFKKIGNPDS